MQVHDAVDHHLRVDAEVALLPGCEQLRDDVGHAADTGLQRGAVVDELLDVLRNRPVLFGDRLLRQLEHGAVRLDDAVDLRNVDAIAAEAAETEDVRHRRIHLADGQPLRIARRFAGRR